SGKGETRWRLVPQSIRPHLPKARIAAEKRHPRENNLALRPPACELESSSGRATVTRAQSSLVLQGGSYDAALHRSHTAAPGLERRRPDSPRSTSSTRLRRTAPARPRVHAAREPRPHAANHSAGQ